MQLVGSSPTSTSSCVYILRLIGSISYTDEYDLMVHPRKYSGIFSRMHFVIHIYNMQQDTKSVRLIAVSKSMQLNPSQKGKMGKSLHD